MADAQTIEVGAVSPDETSQSGQTSQIVSKGSTVVDHLGSTIDDFKELSFRQRLYILFVPVEVIKEDSSLLTKDHADEDDHILQLIIRPEAFRMLFYVGFILFAILAVFISFTWGVDFSVKDNPILDRFGNNNLCIFFDNPPFTYISVILYYPIATSFVLFEFFDLLRTWDCYKDGHPNLSKTFVVVYSVWSGIETFCIIFFFDIFAVPPTENEYIHAIPFLCVILGLWGTCIKRILYFKRVHGEFYQTLPKWYQIVATYIYPVLLVVTGAIKVSLNIPNLLGARLWTIEGLEWTGTFGDINDRIYSLATIVAPVFFYYKVSPVLRVLTLVINRNKVNYAIKNNKK